MFVVCCVLLIVGCLLVGVCSLLSVVGWCVLLVAVGEGCFAVCWLLHVAWCVLFVVCCLLCVVCCLMCVAL